MAKTHSSLTTSDLHHPKGFSVESTATMFVMSQSISTATASFHFLPNDTDTYTLGNTARAWKELYVSTGSIHFVEKDGTVYHKGKEQPKLKGTLNPTKLQPLKKREKKPSKVERWEADTVKLASRYKEKKKVQRKKLQQEIQKQKDFLDHNINKS